MISLAMIIPGLLFAALYINSVVGEWLSWGKTAEDRMANDMAVVFCFAIGLMFVFLGLLFGIVSWRSTIEPRGPRWPSRLATIVHIALLAIFLIPLICMIAGVSSRNHLPDYGPGPDSPDAWSQPWRRDGVEFKPAQAKGDESETQHSTEDHSGK
jgi:cytochrome b561